MLYLGIANYDSELPLILTPSFSYQLLSKGFRGWLLNDVDECRKSPSREVDAMARMDKFVCHF